MLMRQVNVWITDLSPWSYAAFLASGLAAGGATGIMFGRWAGGANPFDTQVLAIASLSWAHCFSSVAG